MRKRDKTRPKVGLIHQKQQKQLTISSESPTCETEGWLLQIPMHNWTCVVKKSVKIHCEEKAMWSWLIWQNCCQENTVEETKQYQKVPLGQGTQRLDNISAILFTIIVSTHLRNDLHAFKINSSDILFHSSSIEVLSEPIFGWFHLFCFLKRPI